MAFSSICSTKSIQPAFQDSLLKYALIKKFLNLMDYQSTLLTPEEVECYYNEYSSKVLNRMLEKKIMRDNWQHGSVCHAGDGCNSVLSENRGFNNGIRRHLPIPTGKGKNARRAINEYAKRPPTIEKELNETIASRTRNARNKIQQNTHDVNRNKEQVKHDDNENQTLQVANKKSREPGKQTRLVADYSTSSSSFGFCSPIIPQKSSRGTTNEQFKKPMTRNEILPKLKRKEQHYRHTDEVSDECTDSDIDDLRLS